MKYCEPCQLDHSDLSRFCKACGNLLIDRSTGADSVDPCVACGAPVQDNWKFCKRCGHGVEGTIVRASQNKARTARMKKIGVSVVAALIILIFATAAAAAGWYALGVRVTVQTEPGAKVVIDGQELGVTNEYGSLTTSRVRAGDHSLTVIREGYDEWQQSFSVSFTDWVKHLNVKLNLTRFKLTVSSSPAGSEVLVDNNSMGSTSAATGTLETALLAPGEHTVLLRHDGYRDWKQNVILKQDQKLDVTLSSAPVFAADSSSADLEVRNALEGWAQSTRNHDLDSHMRYYADTLDYYYSHTQVPASKIRDDRARAFEKFNYLDVRLSNINVQLDSTGQRATVLLDKTFDFRGDNNAFYNGSVQDQLTLTKLGGGWLITGEKELKIYYANK